MSTALSIPQGATVLTLGTPMLLQLIQIANSVITPYAEAMEKHGHLVQLQQWCKDNVQEHSGFKAKYNTPELEEYGWDADELTEYNKNAKISKGLFGSTINMNGNYTEQLGFAKRALKSTWLQSEIDRAKNELEIVEKSVNSNIQYVNLIPPNYRYPLALNEIYSYLANLRAENWKEAVNLYEEQLHRWQMEQNSEEALLLQAQAAALAGKASSRAGTAALFSGLSFFFK